MKGQTVISEALLAIGIILVAIAFVFIGGNIINFQTEGLFTSTEERIPEEINNRINSLPESTGSYSTTYDPGISTYTLTVQGKTINAEIGEQTQSSTTVTEYRLENTRISNSQTICIKKEGINVSLKPGKCVETNLTDFCENSRCINNICQPERGETCSNAQGDCLCPDDAESGEASGVCDTDYEAKSFINADTSGKDTTELGCVKKDYIDVQSQGEKCSQKFECSSGLSCNSPHHSTTGLSDKRCCPDGSSWNGSACQDDEKIKLAFVPLNQNTASYDNAVSAQADFFKERYPIDDDKVEIEKISTVCNVPISGSSCSTSDQIPTLSKVGNCVVNSGQGDADHYIGIFQNNVCGSTAGWSLPSTPAVVAETGNEEVTAHEIGHNYGLNDEYLDSCRYGYGNVSPESSNCLKQSLNGDRGYDTASDRNNGILSNNADFCAGGTASPRDINPSNWGNIDRRYTLWCEGNQNSGGGRGIMSYAGAPGPRNFSEPSFNYLKTLSDFS